MRFLPSTLAALSVIASAATLPTPAAAQAAPEPDPRIICGYLVAEGFFRNFGDCVSGFRILDAEQCRSLTPEQLQSLGYRNLGDCAAIRKREPRT